MCCKMLTIIPDQAFQHCTSHLVPVGFQLCDSYSKADGYVESEITNPGSQMRQGGIQVSRKQTGSLTTLAYMFQ